MLTIPSVTKEVGGKKILADRTLILQVETIHFLPKEINIDMLRTGIAGAGALSKLSLLLGSLREMLESLFSTPAQRLPKMNVKTSRQGNLNRFYVTSEARFL